MKKLPKVVTCLMIIILPLLAEDTGALTIDDEDKVSSKYSDMYDDFETVENAVSAAKGTVGTVKTGKKYVKELKADKFNPIEKTKGALKGLVVKYKSAKMGPLALLKQVSDKISTVLKRVDNRINMWRTTLPTLKAYAKSSKLIANNTVKVFKEFRIKDIWDIERTWSRKLESSILSNYRCFYSFGTWMSHKYYHANREDILKNSMRKYDVLMYSDEALQQGICYNEAALTSNLLVLHTMNTFNYLPKTTLMNAAEALCLTEKILSRSHDYTTKGVSHQQAINDSIANYLQMDKKTFVDDQNISAFIAHKRAEVEIQSTELEQILTNLSVQYSRLLLRQKEQQALGDDKFNNDLKRLINHKRLKSYKEHRKQVFRELS